MSEVHPDALEQMRQGVREGTSWCAYQNMELGHPEAGHLTFLLVGPGCTFEKAPKRHPDTANKIMWRYLLVGKVNLESGKIEDE